MRAALFAALLASSGAALGQWDRPAYRRSETLAEREADYRQRERAAGEAAGDKAARCAEFARRLEQVTKAGRRVADGRHMEHLAELGRRLHAARFSAGC